MDKFEQEGVSILIVEDDPGILMLLRTFFTARGAIVATEKDGRNVLARVEQNKPDIIILDVIMPHVDGLTALAVLRKAGLQTPVIMLTDQNTVDDKVKGLEFGADDYVTKPFSTRELLARVKSLLRRSMQNDDNKENEILSVGRLQIQVPAREIVDEAGIKLHFTKTEFDLLCFLAREKNKAVSHAELLKEVMGYNNDIETKALVMHIANMRRKLQKMGDPEFRIVTVAGVGYKLEAA
ncbi:response regulator transcription factor [Desulfomarina sp.]